MSRHTDLRRFYALLNKLEGTIGGARALSNIGDHQDWPHRGVYFFFEPGEARTDSGEGPRVVRVGTHALTTRSHSTLRQRLGQHRGNVSGGGNHRGSIFRLLIGQALSANGRITAPESWGMKGDPTKAAQALGTDRETLVDAEQPMEHAVTRYLADMRFVFVGVEDEPGPHSRRGEIERNAIALLSNYQRPPLDSPSANWLGHASDRPYVQGSGLWNQRHVGETHDPHFLDTLELVIEGMEVRN